MAYFNEIDEENQLQGQPIATSRPSGQITGVSGGQAGPTANQTAAPKKTFAGIADYLKQNQPQAEQFGQNVADKVQDNADEARKSIGQLTSDFNTQADNNTVKDTTGITGKVESGVALTEDDVERGKSIAQSSYKGPVSISEMGGYGDTRKAQSKAQSQLEATKSDAGTQSLLSQIYGGNRTKGTNTLDSAFLSAGGGKAKLDQVRKDNADIRHALGGAEAQANIKANQAMEESELAKQNFLNVIGTNWAPVDDPLTDEDESQGTGAFAKLKALLEGRKAEVNPNDYEEFSQRIKDNKLTDKDLAALGLKRGDSIYDVDLNTFLADNPQEARYQDFAKEEDVQRYKALMAMAGIEDGSDQITEAGQGYNPYTIQEGISQALQSRKTAIQSDLDKDARALESARAAIMAAPAFNDTGWSLNERLGYGGTAYNSDAVKALQNAYNNALAKYNATKAKYDTLSSKKV